MPVYYLINKFGIYRSRTEYHRPIYNLYLLLKDTSDVRLTEITELKRLLESNVLNPESDVILTNDNYVKIVDTLLKFKGKKIMMHLNSTGSPEFNKNIVYSYKTVENYYRLIDREFFSVFLSRTQQKMYQKWLKISFTHYMVLPNYTISRPIQPLELVSRENETFFYEQILTTLIESSRKIIVFYKMTAFTKILRDQLVKKGYYVLILDSLFKVYKQDEFLEKDTYYSNFRDLDVLKFCYLFIHTSETEGMPSIVKNCFEYGLPVLIPKWD